VLGSVAGCSASFNMKASTGEKKKAKEEPVAKKPEAKPKEEPKKEQEEPAKEKEKPSVTLPGNLVFEAGQTALKPSKETDAILAQLKDFMDQQERVTLLRIEGHSDNTKKPEENMKASGERALSVKNWLVSHGVAATRLVAVGFGETKPIASNDTAEGRAQNRRVEFKIAALNNEPYLGAEPLGGGTEFQ
jgi:OOP family OmpA-OmpF porin